MNNILLKPELMYSDGRSWYGQVFSEKMCLLWSSSKFQLFGQYFLYFWINYNFTVSISWTADCFVTKPSFVVPRRKLQCPVKNCFPVNVQTFIECLSKQEFQKDLNFCSQTWHSDASSWASVMQKDRFAIFKVKVTVRACTVKTYHLYLQNCWSFCNQT